MSLPEILIDPIVVDIAVVLALAAIVVLILHRVRLSPIVGYLLVGILIGALAPELGLLRDPATIGAIATLGVILLIFNIGLELNLGKLRRLGLRIVAIATVEITLVFIVGYWAGTLLGWTFIESVYLGAILSNTGTTVIVKSLIEARKLSTEQGQLVMGLLVVEDLSVIVFLTVLSTLTAPVEFTALDLLAGVGRMGLFAVVALLLGLLVIPRVVDYVADLHLRELLLITVLGLCFGMAVFAVFLGLTPAVGAFVMGVLVAEARRNREVVQSIGPLRDLFVALFFVSMGLLVDLGAMLTYLVLGLVLTAVFLVAKAVLVSLTSSLFGTEGRTAIGVGLSMLAVGEFSLLLAKLGQQDLGVTREFLFPVTMVIVLITGVLAPSTVRHSDRLSLSVFQRLPLRVREYGLLLSRWSARTRRVLEREARVRAAIHEDVVSFLVSLFLLATVGSVAWSVYLFRFELAELLGLPVRFLLAGVGVGFVVAAAPPLVRIVKGVAHLMRVTTGVLVEASPSAALVGFPTLHKVLLLVAGAVAVLVGGFTASVFLVGLLALSPLILLLVVAVTVTAAVLLWDALRILHERLELALVRRLGTGDLESEEGRGPEGQP